MEKPKKIPTFLTMRELSKEVGLSYDFIRRYVKDNDEFDKYKTIRKQNKIMVDYEAFVKYIKEKKHLEA